MGAYIVEHVRTPRGRGRSTGSLHTLTPVTLAAHALRAIRERSLSDASLVDDVVMGIVSPVGEQGGVLPRLAALRAGLPEAVPGRQLNRFCASGLEAVNSAAACVAAGQGDVVIAGGVESMSRVPIGSDGAAWSTDPSLAWETRFVPQGVSADLLATLDGMSREDLDGYALRSQQRAAHAWTQGWFDRSVIRLQDEFGDVILDRDELVRPGTTLSELQALKPAFQATGERGGFDSVALQRYPQVEAIRHMHTAGNSSGIVDGAAAVLLANEDGLRRLGVRARARIVSAVSVGSEPTIMLTAPAEASRRALRRAGMAVGDIDLWEINEAFAAVVLRCMRELGLDQDRVNVAGGAIAMGHPLGATGAMLLGTVLDELERRGLGTALVTLCVGAGMGTATVIERI